MRFSKLENVSGLQEILYLGCLGSRGFVEENQYLDR